MDKLELWKQGEPLFHTKLNCGVNAINQLLNKTAQLTESVNGSGNSVTLPEFYQYQEQIAEMFANDGEGIVLSGAIPYFIGEAGLYARDNGAATIGKQTFPCNPSLTKIADYSELQVGGILYQKITECGDGLKTSLHYAKNSKCIPSNTPSTVYKRLSRITEDCKAYACGKTRPLKAVAVNDTLFNFGGGSGDVITTDAKTCYMCKAADYRLKKQTLKLFCKTDSVTNYFYGLSNEGGLQFVQSNENCRTGKNEYLGIRSGVEFYKVTGCGASFNVCGKLNCHDPIPQKDKLETNVFNFPITTTTYKQHCNQWQACTKCTGFISLETKQVKCNNWQIGFKQSGALNITNYVPCLSNSTTEPQNYKCYDVKASDCEQNIVQVCKKVLGDKTTFELNAFYDFDTTFFCVLNCNGKKYVTLNVASLEAIAVSVANEISVDVVACGIVDTISNGKIKVATTGLNAASADYQANTRASVVSC
jgi:hypothetical protein